ncbi:UDP-glucose 4-epimerase GalE [Streptococcus hongkongensis]
MMSRILVTGGAGFIGSHTCLELLENGHQVIVVDNLSNGHQKSLDKVQSLTEKKLTFYNADIRDYEVLEKIFEKEKIDGVIHFAGLKAVGESTQIPLTYYDNNVCGTISLLKVMQKFHCYNIIFSSSATVYGDPEVVPIKENFPLSVTNPYGRTKLVLEDIFRDLYKSNSKWTIVLLRYFNPIGAHASGELGEDPSGIPNNLLPYITQVAVGKLEAVQVFGNDYETSDGTGVRDYIHIVDLAKGHVAALQKFMSSGGLYTYNLGTGQGYSVLEIIENMSKIVGKDIPYTIAPRRPGDISICFADVSRAKNELGWEAKYDIGRMCRDAWRWQSQHPNGFND